MAEYLCEEDMNTGEYISRDVALRQLNATCLATDCDNYNGVRCRACAYADAMDFIEAIPAADVQPTKWISVKNSVPEAGVNVLVTDGIHMMVTWCEYVDNQCLWVDNYYEYVNVRFKEVTHWMPLPEFPKS